MARSTWGSIRQKSKGVYELRYKADGRAKSETVRGTRKEAEQRLAERRVRFAPDSADDMQITVARCWTHYYRPYVADLAPSTIKGYESAYLTRIKPTFGARTMALIRPIEVQQWLDSMTYGAARKCYAVARAMFGFAKDKELIDRNVMDRRYKLPRSVDRSRSSCEGIYNSETLKSILSECRGEAREAGYLLSAFGGLRRSEAFGVKRDDVVFYDDYAVVKVRRGVQCIEGKVIETEVKTAKSARDAVIPEPYASRLRDLVDERPEDTWLLDDGFGRPMNPEVLAKAYQRWFQRQPYSYIPWRNLRNSYATMLHESGVDLGMIAKMLGHSTPAITFKHYDKPRVEALATAAGKIGV